ncbi:MAG: hypothetical protein FRX49_01486 [Trebouxia sp. A1-2]|nr:MAG: hypothetical protein FRX49_01486 [Trebouxia sp. A1-2]
MAQPLVELKGLPVLLLTAVLFCCGLTLDSQHLILRPRPLDMPEAQEDTMKLDKQPRLREIPLSLLPTLLLLGRSFYVNASGRWLR